MKLLLDENLPHALRLEIVGHECMTAAFMGWSGVSNGKLFRAAADAGFDALLTKDAGLSSEQNLTQLPIAVVILRAATNDIEDLRPLIPALHDALSNLTPLSIRRIP